MGYCVEKLPHSCGTTDALQVFKNSDGKYTGFCFRCKTYVPDPYYDKPEDYSPVKVEKTEEDKKRELESVASLPILALEHRGISQKVAEHYGIRTALSEEDGVTPKAFFFPYHKDGKLVGYKVKTLDKKIWAIGSIKDADPFGWSKAYSLPRKKFFITEGEEDACAVVEIILQYSKPEFRDQFPAVVSLPHGSSSAVASIVPRIRELRDKFDEVILAFDMDEPGQKAREDVLKQAPWMRYAALPEKDANDCLKQGRVKATAHALLFGTVEAPKNTKLIMGKDLVEIGMTPPEMGLSWPFNKLTEVTRGTRDGEVYYGGAGVKMGKSELVDFIAAHRITAHKRKVLLIKPEQNSAADTFRRVVGKATGHIFHDPNLPFDIEAYKQGADFISDNIIVHDSYQFVDWDKLQNDIRAAIVLGVNDVFIDPISCFTTDLTDSEANSELRRIAGEMAMIAKDNSATGFIFCHLKAPQTGASHERGGSVLSTQFAGSRAMMQRCHLMFGLEGNKDPDLAVEERNIRHISVLENRMFGENLKFPIYWDNKTGLFKELG